jgi:hypothetical protein
MSEIETLWDAEIKNELELIATRDIGTEDSKVMIDGITKLMDRRIELKRFDADCQQKKAIQELNQLEYELKKQEYELKKQQLREDKRDRLVKNIMAGAGIALPLLVTIWGTVVSLNFEKEGVVTTGAGRGFINKLFHWK